MTDSTSDLMPPAPPAPRRRPRPHIHCALCQKDAREPIKFGAIRPAIAEMMSAEHPNLAPDDTVCRKHVSDYRTRYVADLLERERGELSELDRQVVESLAREETIARDVEATWEDRRTVGEKVADVVADFGGSWTFIGTFFAVLLVWMGFNIWSAARHIFDPYPFILLNLVLSCLAAIQAPIIMMSQKRQEAKDRLRSENDYQVNLKAELEIRHLHEKLDHLLNRQWERLAEIQQIQLEIMQDMTRQKR
ncbi:MAG TPA: DUF1003 domain-containing protein [Pseudolabrys sp.]|nr:DUF1003 domain-containing protein [Pseudolabrys sp.]